MKSIKLISSAITMLACFLTFGQEKTITGVVSNGKLPLPSANVVIKGSTKSTLTDINGKYTIQAELGDILVFQNVGYTTKMEPVTNSTTIDVTLEIIANPIGRNLNLKSKEITEQATNNSKSDTIMLKEVMVDGPMGIKRTKNSITSSQKIIGNKELTQAGNPSVVGSLTGKVSGLQVNSVSNGVNGETRIVLRGNRSITGNNQALIVIDNVISDATTLEELPPNIVDNVNVIKGAQGAALYGAQGVNGVIIVTTKKGYNKKSDTEEEEEDVKDKNVNTDEDNEETPLNFVPKKSN